MTNKLRRCFARLMLPFVTVTATFFPIQSYAFAPSPLPVYIIPSSVDLASISAGSAASTVGAIDVFAGLALVGLGASLSYMTLDYLLPDGTDGMVRIPLTSANPVPAPLAAPTAATSGGTVNQYALVTLTAAGVNIYTACNGDPVCTNQVVISRGVLNSGSPVTDHNAACVSAGYSMWSTSTGRCDTTGPISSYTNGTQPITCPTGYILSGASCVLDNPRAATPDNKCDIERSGSALAMISDPDCASQGDPIAEICSAAGGASCSRYGFRPSDGQPRRTIITPRSDGGSIVQAQQQHVENGVSKVDTVTVGINPQGIVDSTNSTSQPGVIPATSNPTTGTPDPVLPADTVQVQFPSDYARTGEAATAAKTITDADTAYRNGEQQRWNDRLGVAPPAEIIPSQTHNVSITAVDFSSAAVCPSDIPFTLFGTTYGISYGPMCNLMQQLRPLFLAFGAFAAAYIFIEGLKS